MTAEKRTGRMEKSMKSIRTDIGKGLAAGILICMGCIVNLKAGGGIPGAVLFSAVFFILTILVAIVLVAVPALSHFLGTDGAAGIRLQVHVRGELFNNRSMEIVENLVNLSQDNDAQNHCDERQSNCDVCFHLGTS